MQTKHILLSLSLIGVLLIDACKDNKDDCKDEEAVSLCSLSSIPPERTSTETDAQYNTRLDASRTEAFAECAAIFYNLEQCKTRKSNAFFELF